MKSNNKRPLISCIAFVCKNTESAKKTVMKTNKEYGAIIELMKTVGVES